MNEGTYRLSKQELLEEYDSSTAGLSAEEARTRLEKYGRNEIKEEKEISPLGIFLSQFTDFLVIILIVAAVVSYSIGFFPNQEPHTVDTILILIILLANGIFGFIQDYKAEKSIQALKERASPSSLVLREGKKREIDSEEVVPGDIVFVEQGGSIPADARILDSTNLATDEAALTGESLTVSKRAGSLKEETPLAERSNMLYKGTNVTRGRGKALVVGTGMETEVGKIASEIQQAESRETPFQVEVNKLGKRIGIGVLFICGLVVLVEFLSSSVAILEIFLTSISLAVAAVPEGLPAIVTLSLALGSRKMMDKNALVRKLPVVESLGSVDVICTDKTGTLTEDMMTVKRVYFDGQSYRVTGQGYSTGGDFVVQEGPEEGQGVDSEVLQPLLKCGVSCNNAEETAGGDDEGNYRGDPTEVSLLVSGAKAYLNREEIESENPREREISFTSDRKRMTVVQRDGTVYMKGAPEVVLERCDRIYRGGRPVELTEEKREEILRRNDEFAQDALRVLGFAFKSEENYAELEEEELEEGLVFLGLQGMIDPPREEVKEAVEDCRQAGIEVVMVTGDNPTTAKAVGKEIGFYSERAVEGSQIENMSERELQRTLEEVDIFARVSPSHKVKILKALQDSGHIVAMTGDGVNDAPALKNSDVGVSMGERGTDVAQQSSDMVLLDDNFRTIRDAVSEGRGIFDNIRKFVNYLLSANTAEVLVVFLASLLGPWLFTGNEFLALTAVMLLWINLLTDGLPALALGVDPKSPGIMARKPRSAEEGVIDSRMLYSITSMGILMAAVTLTLFGFYLPDIQLAQTVAFTSLVVFELVRIQAIRSRYQVSIFSNKWLVMAVISSLGLQLLVLYSPLNDFFGVSPIGLAPWLAILAGLVTFGLGTWVLVKVGDYVFES